MIEIEHLTKEYPSRVAVKDLTFSVKKGEILGFLGPNGAGKTTTMRMLTGYLPPTSGRASVAGFDVFAQSLEARRHIGYLPENVPLYTDMTVKGYLKFHGKIRGLADRALAARLDYVIQATHIEDRRDQLIQKLSKGYRQRVGLAQALIHNPDVLILDEPTVGLDPRQIIEVRELIKGLGGDHTIILSTHILPEVSVTANRVVIINNGQIVATDTPTNLTHRLQGEQSVKAVVRGPAEAIRQQIGKLPRVRRVETGPAGDGLVSLVVTGAEGADVREDVARAVVRGNWGLLELSAASMSLEEIYLKLTTDEEPEVADASAEDAPVEAAAR